MSKKRKRKRRYRKRSYTKHPAENLHHMLWMRKKWGRTTFAHQLRNHDYFIVKIPAHTIHRQIHESMSEIPVPPEEFCELIYESIEEFLYRGDIDMEDRPSQRLDVLLSIMKGILGPTEATVIALEKQRAILAQGGL